MSMSSTTVGNSLTLSPSAIAPLPSTPPLLSHKSSSESLSNSDSTAPSSGPSPCSRHRSLELNNTKEVAEAHQTSQDDQVVAISAPTPQHPPLPPFLLRASSPIPSLFGCDVALPDSPPSSVASPVATPALSSVVSSPAGTRPSSPRSLPDLSKARLAISRPGSRRYSKSAPVSTKGSRPPSPLAVALQMRLEMTRSPSSSTTSSSAASPVPSRPSSREIPEQPYLENPFGFKESEAAYEWARRKQVHKEENEAIEELMKFEGLEEVKLAFLSVLDKVRICKMQKRPLNKERYNIVFQGNPGTGKTTVARLYSKFLRTVGVFKSQRYDHSEEYSKFLRTVSVLKSQCYDHSEGSGMEIAAKGVHETKEGIDRIVGAEGGVMFVDEAYQLIAPYMDGVGRQTLDVILTAMENHMDKLAVVFAGYKDEMEPFFEHNPGLRSRIPYTINFEDYTDAELWKIMYDTIHTNYAGQMKIEGGIDGLYMRIAIRRLGRGRSCRGFGNARAVQNLLSVIERRQVRRLTQASHEGKEPDYFFFSKEDLIGPEPTEAAAQSAAWKKLQSLIGLEEVKESVQRTINMIHVNYRLELAERKPLAVSLNQVFVGAPGTGKTTVATLYGQILADLGLLSRGDLVMKNPSDFIGECLGKSEAKTAEILKATVGKVLVIDEAYMLDAGDAQKDQDKFKTGVIDTLVSMVQGVPGEDRSIILVGYEDKIKDMFHNVNPGLTRRFPIEEPFRFHNFSLNQLMEILQLKMREQDVDCTPKTLEIARSVFERSLIRPNFTNAGEVESCLSKAKLSYGARISRNPFDAIDGMLEPEDFDPNYNRGAQTKVNTRNALQGRVSESVIEKLSGYQSRYVGAEMHGLNPREHVPTNFVFKGFAGTGKTTAAQHMGQIFYDMGFLSSPNVVECSATDLLGQYVGQTAPKTRKMLDKALGKVLFIDEAYRLISGSYAAEAVDELSQFLNRPSNMGKIVVILAGWPQEINLLMSTRTDLSALFTEDIVFPNLNPEDSITLLIRELERIRITAESDFLRDKTSLGYKQVVKLFHAMQVVPGWSNARDVKSLANRILGKFLETMGQQQNQQTLALSPKALIDCMGAMILQRRDRYKIKPASQVCAEQCQALPAEGSPAPAAGPAVCTPGAGGGGGGGAGAGANYSASGANAHIDYGQNAATAGTRLNANNNNAQQGSVRREGGVTEQQWQELRTAKVTQDGERKQQNVRRRQLQGEIADVEGELANSNDGNDITRLTDKRDALRNELNHIERALRDQEKVEQALRSMNRCANGYAWYRVVGGWRCEGGAHYVAKSEIEKYLR